MNLSAELSKDDPTSRGTYYQAGDFSTRETAQVSGFFDHDRNPATPEQQRFGPDALTEVYDSSTGEFVTLGLGSDGVPDDIDTRYAANLRSAEVSDDNLVQIWGVPDREAFRSFINAGLLLHRGQEMYGWANYSWSDSNGSFFYRRPSDPTLVPLRTETGEIYNPRDRYPAGFTPRFHGEVIDMGITVGIRGEFGSGLP